MAASPDVHVAGTWTLRDGRVWMFRRERGNKTWKIIPPKPGKPYTASERQFLSFWLNIRFADYGAGA